MPEGVYPELNDAFGAEAEQGMNRFASLGEHAPGPRVRVTTTVVAPRGFAFDDAKGRPRLIGAAFTDTPDGRAALAMACVLAARARGLVRVLTVTEPLEPLTSGALEPDVLGHVFGPRAERAATVLRRGLDAVSAGRSAGGEILTGHPAHALAAASEDLDLLVCGSRGYGPVRTLLLGGTSNASRYAIRRGLVQA